MRISILVIFIFLFSLFTSSFSFAETTGENIILPLPSTSGGAPLMDALKNRHSSRSFADTDFSDQMISNLLWAACGVNRSHSNMRTAPSAKNLQEIDIYVALKSGTYIYNAQDNILEIVLAEDIRSDVGIQDFTVKAPVGLVFVADYDKMKMGEKYNAFYASTDTGFISQNVYLFCASEGLSTVVLGWVDKEKLAKTLKLSSTQHIILSQPVGYLDNGLDSIL